MSKNPGCQNPKFDFHEPQTMYWALSVGQALCKVERLRRGKSLTLVLRAVCQKSLNCCEKCKFGSFSECSGSWEYSPKLLTSCHTLGILPATLTKVFVNLSWFDSAGHIKARDFLSSFSPGVERRDTQQDSLWLHYFLQIIFLVTFPFVFLLHLVCFLRIGSKPYQAGYVCTFGTLCPRCSLG